LPCVSIRAGVAGYAATLSAGSIVRVQFDDGDPTLPRVVGFGVDDSECRVPLTQSFDAKTSVSLGHDASHVYLGVGAAIVVRNGDVVATGLVAGTVPVTGRLYVTSTCKVSA
jgi:hypothetical protein